MICRYDSVNKEVTLSNPKLSDILILISLMFHKDKEVVFSNPHQMIQDEVKK